MIVRGRMRRMGVLVVNKKRSNGGFGIDFFFFLKEGIL